MLQVGRVFASVVLVALTGCSANHHSIFRHQPVVTTAPSLTVIDAKQRAILSAPPPTGATENIIRFCSEPSPDVFAVIAQSLSAGGSFGQSGDPKSIQAALNAAFSSSEQGSTIPRTQTTNMLREVMFRTCERYLSGGISEVELSLQAVRDQRLIVSILAIEQLTGVVTPKPVVIGASASGSAGSSGADAAIRLDDQNKTMQDKVAAEKKKQAAFDELNGTPKDCETIAKAVADNKADTLSESLKTKRPKCEAASTELAAAKKEKAEAAAHYERLASVASAGGIPVSVNGTLMVPVAGGGLDGGQSAAIGQVATTVERIVKSTFEQDEFLFLCLKVLKDTATLGQLSANCLKYIESQVELQRQRNVTTASEIEAARTGVRERTESLFDQFWSLVSKDDQIDAAKLAAVKSKIKIADWPLCFNAAKAKAEYQKCFDTPGSVPAEVKRALARGSSSNG